MKARIEEYQRELAYRIYITDSLKSQLGLKVRYIDIIKSEQVIETRSEEEIISNISSKLKEIGGDK